MLKEIPTSQLRKGMYLSKLCGNWLDHPFWKQSFLVEDASKIKAIQQSGVKRVVIDTKKGLDVLVEPKAEPAPVKAEAPPKVVKKKPKPASAAEEWNKAKKICDQAKGAVTKMFQDVRMGNAVNVEEVGEQTVGLLLEGGGQRAAYIPGCATVPDWLLERLDGVDLLLFDGTVWNNDASS